MMRLGRALAFAAPLAFAGFVVVACYSPTEVRLEITTDHACVAQLSAVDAAPHLGTSVRTRIQVGPSAGELDDGVETDRCEGVGDIGSLVLLPRGGERDARATVQVTMTVDGSDPVLCANPGTFGSQCIVTRRTFSFIEHTSRALPIRLYEACKGVLCRPDQGCDELGVCKFADIDRSCEGDACDGGAPDVVDAARDVMLFTDTGADVVPKAECTGLSGMGHVLATGSPNDENDKLASNSSTLFWIINNTTLGTVLKNGGKAPPPPTDPSWDQLTAIAADERGLWVATQQFVERFDFMTKQFGTKIPLSNVRSIAIDEGTGTTFMTNIGGGGSMPALYMLAPGASTPAQIQNSLGGERVVVGGDIAYAFDNGSGTVFRFIPGFLGMVTAQPTGGPILGAAATSTSAFLVVNESTSMKNPMKVSSTAGPPQKIYDVTSGGPVAVDTKVVYYVDQGTLQPPNPAALRRGAMVGPTAGALSPVAMGFTTIDSLVIDDDKMTTAGCAYFWARTSGGGPIPRNELHVYPKNPVAPAPGN